MTTPVKSRDLHTKGEWTRMALGSRDVMTFLDMMRRGRFVVTFNPDSVLGQIEDVDGRPLSLAEKPGMRCSNPIILFHAGLLDGFGIITQAGLNALGISGRNISGEST